MVDTRDDTINRLNVQVREKYPEFSKHICITKANILAREDGRDYSLFIKGVPVSVCTDKEGVMYLIDQYSRHPWYIDPECRKNHEPYDNTRHKGTIPLCA